MIELYTDIYDGAGWTGTDVDDLKAAIAHGASVEEAAAHLCRSGTVDEVRRKCRELGLTPETAGS
jgi:hypothetical protein